MFLGVSLADISYDVLWSSFGVYLIRVHAGLQEIALVENKALVRVISVDKCRRVWQTP